MRRCWLIQLSCGLALALALASCGKDETPPSTDSAGTVLDHGLSGDGAGVADHGATGDQSVQGDGAASDQGTATGDGSPVTLADGRVWEREGGTALSCGQIGLCSERCGKTCTGLVKIACLIKCNNDCKAQGCASAKPLFDTLTTCIQSQCILDCGGGPSAKCTTCTTTKCAKQTNACNANKC